MLFLFAILMVSLQGVAAGEAAQCASQQAERMSCCASTPALEEPCCSTCGCPMEAPAPREREERIRVWHAQVVLAPLPAKLFELPEPVREVRVFHVPPTEPLTAVARPDRGRAPPVVG
jgi:hypothetical protein